jgi:type III pantothenate kinase
MLLAIDIGNSTIKFAVYEGTELLHRFSIATKRDYTVDELKSDRLMFVTTRIGPVDRVIASSVVPEVNAAIRDACREIFKVTPVFVTNRANFGFSIKYDPPSGAGTDRLVNAFAAAEKYGRPVIACSLGTATTVDVVNHHNEYIGGIIAPGMAMMAEALHLKTSKLPKVEITEPQKLIGNSTVESIRSGVYFGYAGMVESLVNRFVAKIEFTGKAKPQVIATGGFAKLIASAVSCFDTVDETLTLDGLRMLADRY